MDDELVGFSGRAEAGLRRRQQNEHWMKLALFILAFLIQPIAAQRTIIAKRPAYIPTNVPDLPGLQAVSGEQVEEFLASPKRKRDASVARQLDSVVLTERFTAARLARCEKEAPGRKAKQALIALADRSAFNPPATEEILSLAEPSIVDQRKMLALTADYVVNALHHLPDFYATRVTTTYRLEGDGQGAQIKGAGKDSVTVYYRNGEEELGSQKHRSKSEGLTTRGEFGPVLGLAVLDAAKGNLAWNRWELGEAGPRAVYSYAVTAANSHYEVSDRIIAYKGEITVDPASGAIVRLILKADPGKQTRAADIEVDYGPVDLGGHTYLCPVKSIALSNSSNQVWLNDVVFEGYHLFQAESHVLPGYKANN
jgi:hypothetical protein